MKIRPRYLSSTLDNPIYWYSGLSDYNPSQYSHSYNTNELVAGDVRDSILSPWVSNIKGFDIGRYTPTGGHGAFGEEGPHYNYTLGVEKQPYYIQFGEDIWDEEKNTFTPLGIEWAKAVDKLIPENNHAARFFDEKGLKTFWTTSHKDAHGRPPKTYNNLKEYVEAVRRDQILGARHNVFLNRGKRYFYKDINGQEHWVNPNDISNYNVSEKPVRSNWTNDHTIYWEDYELTGPSLNVNYEDNSPIINEGDLEAPRKGGNQETGHNDKYGINWDKFKSALADPDIIGLGRLYNTIRSNNRIYDHALAAINPDLIDSYHTHRQVVGDEALKLNYYRQAAAGEAMASRAYTSDASRQLAYLLEAKNIGDLLRNQGNIIDNAEVRRTSDESNQHLWANTLRDTEVANRNRSAINQAKSLRENLKALKYAALMTSWDNWLREWQTRLQLKKDRREALQALLDNYDYQNLIDSDLKLNQLMLDIQKSEYTDLEKIRQYKLRRRELERMILQHRIDSGKKGMKFTYKSKDDLLYKASRDAVEHFRKMSKYASDSYNRKRPKIEKLAPHPKGTRKYQQGGLAPFMVYTPAPIGGERSYQSEITSSSNSGKSSSSGDGANKKSGVLDMVKTLFLLLSANGLPVDVSGVYSKVNRFLNMSRFMGEDLTESDIASMYLQTLYDVTNIRNSYNLFNKTREEVSKNDALGEFAVTDSGRYIVQSSDGKLKEASLKEIKEDSSLNPLTNNDILFLRQYNPDMMLTVGNRYMSAVSNGIGLNKIAQYIKSIAPNIGDTETTIEGYTKQESGLIRQGINLLQNAPKGDYKYLEYFKNADARKAVNAAFNYVKAMLPTNYKAILDINAYKKGISVNNLIKSLMEIGIDQEYRIGVEAVTGKAAKDANGNSKSSSGTDTPSVVQFLLGNGYLEKIELNVGNSLSVKVLGRFGILQDSSKKNLGLGSTLKDVSQSLFGPVLDLDKATFGGTRLHDKAYEHIILNNSDCVGMDLPVTVDKSGNYVPDFLLTKLIEEAEEKIYNENISDKNKVNLIYTSLGLPPKYNLNGDLNTRNYKRFAAIKVTLDEKALKGGKPIYPDEVTEASDEDRRLFEEIMRKLGKEGLEYELNDGWLWTNWKRNNLYEGYIFAPVREDIVGGFISGGQPLDTDIPNNANQTQMKQYTPKIFEYKETPPLSSLK